MLDVDPELIAFLERNSYSHITMRAGMLYASENFMFTTGLVVGLTWGGYSRRYCYEEIDDALCALQQWSGRDHPGGDWIKVKGFDETGKRVDMLNPLICA